LDQPATVGGKLGRTGAVKRRAFQLGEHGSGGHDGSRTRIVVDGLDRLDLLYRPPMRKMAMSI